MNIKVKNQVLERFLTGLLQIEGSNPYGITVSENLWGGSNSHILTLIERANAGKPTLLPFRRGTKVFWLLLASNEQQLLRTISEMSHLLVPYFSQFSSDAKQFFDPNSSLGKYGSELYPFGYFLLQSQIDLEDTVLQRLDIWVKLDDRRPEIEYEELEVNVFRLRSRFKQAISLKKWEEANQILVELKTGHFLTDENVRFLSIQLYSSQGKWEEIWKSHDFELLAGLKRLPLRVHSELLHAYYQSVLMVTDDRHDFNTSYTFFTETRERLGTLIRSQLGLDEEYLLRVFAYEAAFKTQLDKLERYLEKAEDDLTIALIEFLIKNVKGVIDPPEPEDIPLLEQAKEHYHAERYEDAYLTLLESETSIEQVGLLAGIATMVELDEILNTAYEQYNKLSQEEQKLLRSQPTVKGNILYVLQWKKGRVITPVQSDPEVIEKLSWYDWFTNLLSKNPDIDFLEQQLHKMDEQEDRITFSFKSLQDLSDIIMEVAVEEEFSMGQKLLLNTAIPMFVSHLMLDKYFPNHKAIYVYEYTIELLFTHAKKNSDNTAFVLRLMEGVLILDLEFAQKFWTNIKKWFHIPPVDRLSQSLLEAIELFKDFGISNAELLDVWSTWATGLMERFANEKQAVVESWIKVGTDIGGDPYIIDSLERHIRATEVVDPILKLNDVVITIYSLREKAALRAAERIKKRNSKIKVRVCTDSKLTTEAKSYAANSDYVILVTTCMSHALTYGISPFLTQKPIYPRSSGETSILEALEEYLDNNLEVDKAS